MTCETLGRGAHGVRAVTPVVRGVTILPTWACPMQ